MDISDELQSIISEQRRELEAATAVESDLDLAFNLQMQEAVYASLSSQPSSSTPPSFHPTDDAVSVSGFAHLVAEELASFERELNDRKHVEAEMKNMRVDLNRRIHDQIFARDLFGVPEEQWNKTGDHFERPYDGEGSDSETFRLYFKGLVRDEMVKDVKKTLGGLGVAICDKFDNPVFELRKPLIGGEMVGDVVEIKALIEGLTAAVTLGLERVTIFCHDNELYQFITGKWIPKPGNFATLVGQVALLQRKFTYCNPSLVALMDIKFAVKFARDAVVSQVTRPAENIHRKNLIETCGICLEDNEVAQMFPIDNCLHRYCFSCMKQHAEVKLLLGMLPKCPHEGCNSELKLSSCKRFLTSELYDVMSQRIKESSIPVLEKVYCPYPRCSALMSKTDVLGNAAGAVKCVKCRGLFCMNCKVPWHSNMTCNTYKILYPYPCAEDAKLKSLATQNLWRQCVKCNHMVELAEGCYHIYCRCGYEFCYTCGAEWKNKKPTCRCPIWDERNIIHNEQAIT